MEVDEGMDMDPAPGPNKTSETLPKDNKSNMDKMKPAASIGIIFLAVAGVFYSQDHKLNDPLLQEFTEYLLSVDKAHNNVYDKLLVKSSGPMFLNVLDGFTEAQLLNGPTITPLIALQNYYKTDVLEAEEYTELHETFLNAIMNTQVMKETEMFLIHQEILPIPLKNVLKHMWFGMFSKDEPCKKCNPNKSKCDCKPVVGSSGFEHVFAAETMTKLTKAGDEGNKIVQGFHNWIYFFRKQADPNFKYTTCNGKLRLGDKADIISLDFEWKIKEWGDRKPKRSTMFIGTSPEFEMAVYTICFLTRTNKPCNVKMAGEIVIVKTHSQKTENREESDILTSAYPHEDSLPKSCDVYVDRAADDNMEMS